jgi:hypothetical protein
VKSKGSFLTSGFGIRYNGAMAKESFLSLLEEWMKKHRLPLMTVIWVITCLIIGVLILTGLEGYSGAERGMARQFNTQQLILAQQAARGMESFLGEIRQTALLLTLLPEIQNFGEGKSRKGGKRFCGNSMRVFPGNSAPLLGIGGWEKGLVPPPEGWKKLGEQRRVSFPGGKTSEQSYSIRLSPKTGRRAKIEAGGFGADHDPGFRGRGLLGTLGCLLDFNRISERFLATSAGQDRRSLDDRSGRPFVAHYETELVGQMPFPPEEIEIRISPKRLDRILREEMIKGKTGVDEYVAAWHREKRAPSS